MLVIVIFGAIATFGFRKKLIEKGYEESRAWAYPLLTGSFIYCFGWAINTLSRFWIKNPEAPIYRSYPFIVGLMAILVHGLLVSKLWKQIKALPDRED